MNCSCPRCAAQNEVDLSVITEKGLDAICTGCNTRFWIYRESFGGRALKRAGEIYCVECGLDLGHSIACQSCGTLYPAYFAVHKTKVIRKRTPTVRKSFVFYQRPVRKPRRRPVAAPKKQVKEAKRLNKYLAWVAVFVVLASIGGVVYARYRAETLYTRNYLRTLYVIKSGTDLSLGACKKLIANSRESLAAGRAFSLRVSTADESRLAGVKAEAEKLVHQTGKPPKKYMSANEKLTTLYGVFERINTLALQPPDSLQGLSDSADKLEGEFKKGVQDLKAALPGKLAEDLKNARTKYRVFRDF
jgi:hypothetical protein